MNEYQKLFDIIIREFIPEQENLIKQMVSHLDEGIFRHLAFSGFLDHNCDKLDCKGQNHLRVVNGKVEIVHGQRPDETAERIMMRATDEVLQILFDRVWTLAVDDIWKGEWTGHSSMVINTGEHYPFDFDWKKDWVKEIEA